MTVLRASSAVRLRFGEEIRLVADEARGRTEIVVRTRYEAFPATQGQIPRELWVELSGPGESLDEAMRRHNDLAGTVASILTLAANAGVEQLQVELAFDATPEVNEHEFFQNFLLDETGMPRISRGPDADAFTSLFTKMVESPKRDRLFRAAAQYQIALQHWIPGHEILALAHLYMAMEALTPVALEAAAESAGGKEALVASWGIEIKKLDPEVRRRILFQGDDEAYREARMASDGFEHGFLDFEKIRSYSVARREPVAKYVRMALLEYSRLEDSVRVTLLDDRLRLPIASTRLAKYLKATLVGPVDKLAPPELQYPMFRLRSAISSVTNEADGTVTIEPKETGDALLGEGVLAMNPHLEVWGPDKGLTGSPAQPLMKGAAIQADVVVSPEDSARPSALRRLWRALRLAGKGK